MPVDATPPVVLEGVPLELYAGVTVALAEGFPLEAVLANDDLPIAIWQSAKIAWRERLATEGPDGPLFTTFRTRRAEAEDWLARPVLPIDRDLDAWMAFLAAFSASPDAAGMLQSRGLGVNDLARLQRAWSHALEEDDALRKKAAEIAKKGPGPLPALRVEPATLKPFPWSQRGKAPVEAQQAASSDVSPPATEDDLSLDRYAALTVELAEHRADRAMVLARFGLDAAALAPLEERMRQRLAADAGLARDFQQLRGHHRARLSSATRRRDPQEAPPRDSWRAADDRPPVIVDMAPLPPPVALRGTSLAVDVPQGPALPFVESAELVSASPAEGPHPRLTLQQHVSLCVELLGTEAEAVVLARYGISAEEKEQIDRHYRARMAREPDLKLAWNNAYQTYRVWFLQQGKRKAADPALPRVMQPPQELLATAAAVDAPSGPALPFDAAPSPTASESPPASFRPLGFVLPKNLPPPKFTDAHSRVAAQHALAATAAAPDQPAGPALPFAKGALPSSSPSPTILPEVVVARGELTGTAAASEVPTGPALPFEPASEKAPPPAKAWLGFEVPKNLPPPKATVPRPPPLSMPVVPTPSKLAATAAAPESASGPALPFAKGPAVVVTSPPVVNRAPRELTGTTEASDVPAGPALPFNPAAPGAASSTAPALPLKQHASLCVELEVTPDRAAEALARYGITAGQKTHADQYYRERLAKEPELKRAWDEAYQAYRSWFLSKR